MEKIVVMNSSGLEPWIVELKLWGHKSQLSTTLINFIVTLCSSSIISTIPTSLWGRLISWGIRSTESSDSFLIICLLFGTRAKKINHYPPTTIYERPVPWLEVCYQHLVTNSRSLLKIFKITSTQSWIPNI